MIDEKILADLYPDIQSCISVDITGALVHGQVTFPSGTTISCYGTDSTCSGTPVDTTLDYGADGEFSNDESLSGNPCCFEVDSTFAFLPNNYYTALGSRCQSCSGKQLFLLSSETYNIYSHIIET